MGHALQFSLLLVEPHTDSREMYAAYLRHHGVVVHETDGTISALAKAGRADIIVIAGHSSDALRLVEHLRAAPSTRELPIVVLSGTGSSRDATRAADAGCDCFVTIPHSPEELLTTVRRVIARHRWTTGRSTAPSSADATPARRHRRYR